MYSSFYGFSERPFDITPDPRFLHLTPTHREALASMIYGVKERKGFISVTGEVGTGKTLLIYALLRNLPERVKVVHVSHTGITFEQLLRTIFLELGEPQAGEEMYLLLHRLHQYLLRKLPSGENVTLIIDEAQNLSKEVMEDIRMLSNLETATVKLLQVLLVGQPELETKLNSDDLRQFKQRIGIRRNIKPLNSEECRQYMEHRLRLVGSSLADVFAADAVPLISDYTGGIPRLINILCDNAFLIGFSLDRKRIAADIVREAISDMEGGVDRKTEGPPSGDGGVKGPAPDGDDFASPARPENQIDYRTFVSGKQPSPVGLGTTTRKIEQLHKWLLLVHSRRQSKRGRKEDVKDV
jgi:general secretion pathway protein A